MMLSIVISIFNKWKFTESCITDLAQLPEDHELIIIDNASTDETSKEIIPLFDTLNLKYPAGCKLNYFKNDKNEFHSKACNIGYYKAKSENILFLNNDIRVKANHLTWTSDIINACKNDVLIGPTMGQLDKQLNFVKEANQYLDGNSYISGWCLAGNKKTLSRLNNGSNKIWNENYPMYFNDADLSFRARKLGIKLEVIQLPDVVHFGKISSKQLDVNKLYNEGRKVFLKDWQK
jgi:GT2 family glycosyltransferase